MGDHHPPRSRLAEAALNDRLRRMPVVVLTGARQTGKTTLVRAFEGAAGRRYVSLDNVSNLDRARSAPAALVSAAEPMTIDEVQRAPDLLLAVKDDVDSARRPGRFLLTGSSNLLLLRNVSETLAGRAAHLVLRPLTERERRGDSTMPVWPSLLAAANADAALPALGIHHEIDWAEAALRGGLPPASLAAGPDDRHVWFESYVDTYLHRDLRDAAQVGDLAAFGRLLRLAALRVGGLLNIADLGRDAAVPRTSAQRWISILEATFAVTLLPAFSESSTHRIIRCPKLYLLDTGLGLHLAGVDGRDALLACRNCGAWLESVVLNDLLAWRETEIRKPFVGYRRTASGAEIDFVVEHGGRLLPIEVKASSDPRVKDGAAIEAFCAEFGDRAPFGLVLHSGRETFRLSGHVVAAPLGAVL